jgi:hypothetical protein
MRAKRYGEIHAFVTPFEGESSDGRGRIRVQNSDAIARELRCPVDRRVRVHKHAIALLLAARGQIIDSYVTEAPYVAPNSKRGWVRTHH